jgi:hypothetical protein
MEPFKYDWVVRYYPIGKPQTMRTFAGFKQSGKPSYTGKVENIKMFRLHKEAFEVARQLIDTEEYIADVFKIRAGRNDHFYFVRG